MLTKKLLLSTFGAKIAPYGFEYKGYHARRWTFSRTINGEKQVFVIQKDIQSFMVEIPSRMNGEEIGELISHFYRDDAELEDLLNLLGDHFVRRVIPELDKPAPQEEEKREFAITGEMYDRLMDEKEELSERFMESHGLDWTCGPDEVLGQLLCEVGQIREKPFHGLEEKLVELAAVYGEVVIRTVGGEWMRRKDWSEKIEETVIGDFAYTHITLDPMLVLCFGWQDGEVWVLKNYMSKLSDYRKWSARQREEYGDGWQPPKTKTVAEASLLDGKAVEETIGKRMEDMGFAYCGETSGGWMLEKNRGGEREIIQVRKDIWGRKAFFAIHSIPEEGEYRYREFCFYRDGEDMCAQLGRVGEGMREAFLQDRRTEEPRKIPSFRYHLTSDDKERFLIGRKGMAEKWRKENRVEETSGEEEILLSLSERLDAMQYIPYEECREELLAMAAVFGDLLIREIGGRWREYEGWRMHQIGAGLTDQPGNGIVGIGLINLPDAMVRYWEWEGGRTLMRAYRESVWQHEKWKKICGLGGLEA